MYCEMFGLQAAPFNNTPDPKFFFNTPDHEEALASLQYAAGQRKGFVLVTGEVGSGKTLLSRMLTQCLPTGAKTAVITNTRLTGRELLWAVCREFEIDVSAETPVVLLLKALEDYLLEQYARDRLAVIILDEAQNLPVEAFEELRLLGNLEADDAKLLQVMILGQPELQQTFRRPELRQIAQRIFRSYHLTGMNQALTAGYIRHRLTVAGAKTDNSIFDDHALAAIYRCSRGLPRLINQLCDNAMLAAYADSRAQIGADLIDEVAGHLLLEGPMRRNAEGSDVRRGGSSTDSPGPDRASQTLVDDEVRQSLARTQQRLAALEAQAEARPAVLLSEKNAVREEFRELFEEMRLHGTTLRSQWQETSRQQQDEFRRLFDEQRALGDAAREHAKEATAQARGEFEQWRLEVQALADQLRQRIRSLDERNHALDARLNTVDGYIKEQATPIGEERKQLKSEVRAALQTLSHAQAQADADVRRRREETERFTEQSRRLLTETREQAASLLAGLRLHFGETCGEAAKGWKNMLDEGKAEAQQLESRVALARAQAATVEAELEKSLHAVRDALAQASSDGGRMRQELDRHTEQARNEIEHLAQRQRRILAEAFNADRQQLAETFDTDRRKLAEAVDSERQRLETVLDQARASETSVAAWRARLDEVGTQVQQWTTDLHVRLDAAKELSAVLRIDLDESLRTTQKAVTTIQEHGRTFTTALMHRVGQCARDAKTAQARAQSTVDEIARIRDDALAQLRSAYAQMHERAQHDRTDLVNLAEEVRAIAGRCVERLRDLRGEETGRLEGLAESAATLLQQATATLADVTSTSREAKAESHAALDQARSVRDAVERSQQRVREVHAEALALLQEAATSHEQSREDVRALREEMAAARRSVEQVAAIPREMIADANSKAETLTALAARITSVYQKLTTAEARAANEQEALERANTEASGTLKQLRLHAQRVGQLVGIIRQVYGAMDARVERIARGLSTAGEIFQLVPKEIDTMRKALGSTAPNESARGTPATARRDPRSTRMTLKSTGPAVLPRPKNVAELPFANGTLGEIAQRSQKLNAWLKDVLAREDDVKLAEDSVDRLGDNVTASTRDKIAQSAPAPSA